MTDEPHEWAYEGSVADDDQMAALVRDLLASHGLEETGSLFLDPEGLMQSSAIELIAMASAVAADAQKDGEFLLLAALPSGDSGVFVKARKR